MRQAYQNAENHSDARAKKDINRRNIRVRLSISYTGT